MTLSRSLLIGLIASAALNVFLIGGVAGVVWVRRSAPPPPPHYAELPERPLPGEASPEQVLPPLRQPPAPRARLENPPVRGEQMGRRPLWAAGQNLSPESRQALRRALREANQRNQPITRQARGERQAALQALKAKSYDPAEVSRRLAAARALEVQARGNVEVAVSNYAATLSPEERLALADGLARVYAPRPRANGQPR